MTSEWANLAWRSLPVILLLAWFVLLIGGFFLGGLVHIALLAALAVFGYQQLADRPG